MSAALPKLAAGSPRLLADVRAIERVIREAGPPAQRRLEAAVGRELAGRLVAALCRDARRG
ncbi:MAG TPA: hypothetical protein VNJ46_05960 [Gaiellaceae bacterium]|nr:hypothetical protein [Gaiellaceae bacterium]